MPYTEDSSNTLTSASSGQSAPAYLRPAENTKFRNYVFDTFGPYPVVGAGIAAGINQISNAPPEWNQGVEGYAKRFGSDFGIAAVGTTARYGLAEAFKEDTLYYRCECRGLVPRMGHAVLSTLTARRGEDGHRLTFEQNLQHGVAVAMQAAEAQAGALRGRAREDACGLRGGAASSSRSSNPSSTPPPRRWLGYRSSVRGPFYSPLRLPDVLLDVARRSESSGRPTAIAARAATVTAAAGLRPDDLLFLGCAAASCPTRPSSRVSEFYSLNQALVPQHVVFEIDADDLGTNTASMLRTLADVREMGFQLCISGLGAQFTTLELIAEARPDFLCLDPLLVASLGGDAHADRGGAAPGALRRPHRRAAHRARACATARSNALLAAQRRRAAVRRAVRAAGHAAAAGVVRGVSGQPAPAPGPGVRR